MATFCSFLWLSSIPLYTAVSLCIHVSEHLDCLRVLAIVNNAPMNIEVHVSFHIGVCFSFKYCMVEFFFFANPITEKFIQKHGTET